MASTSSSTRISSPSSADEPHPPAPNWARLPGDALLAAFSRLCPQELVAAGTVCSAWHAASKADRLWVQLLQSCYGRTQPAAGAPAARTCFMQLRTAQLHACGGSLGSLLCGSACSRPTELTAVWASSAAPLPQHGAVASAGCDRVRLDQLPPCIGVIAVAAGRSHAILLAADGGVFDTRAKAAAAAAADDDDGGGAAAAAATATADGSAAPPAAEAVPGGGAGAGVQQQPQAAPAALQPPLEQTLLQQAAGELQIRSPWRPPGGARISSIATGADHTIAVSDCGRAWAWGNNTAGQLGLGHTWPWLPQPAETTPHALCSADGGERSGRIAVRAAACGAAHSALLLADGRVVSAGCNSEGQAGRGEQQAVCPEWGTPACASPDSGVLAAAAIACGAANTAVATQAGRLLVCGATHSGVCGGGLIKAGASHALVDIGPCIAWHGLTRPSAAAVAAAGGDGAAALPKVVQVAVGCGTCYALTVGGELFACGAGSKGQLGTGGCAKVQATPAKLPWAQGITSIAASLDGCYAAAVDAVGRLYTWGSGSRGQLGHGDTAKRTVGRVVKVLKQSHVLQVACGSESLLVLTCARRPQHGAVTGAGPTAASSSCRARAASVVGSGGDAAGPQRKGRQRQGSEVGGPGTCLPAGWPMPSDSAAWVDVEGEGPFWSPVPANRRGRSSRQQPQYAAAAAPPALAPPRSAAVAAADAAAAAGCADGRASAQQGEHSCSDSGDAEASAASACRTSGSGLAAAARSPRASSSSGLSSSRAGSSGSSRAGTDAWPPPARVDKQFKRLLRRVLGGFMADNRRREMSFPASLSAADRYAVHVAAEAYGLAHASHNEGAGERVIKVWKVSRTRRMPMPSSTGSDDDG